LGSTHSPSRSSRACSAKNGFSKRLAEPDSLDDRISGDDRQREHRPDDSPNRRPYRETKQHRDTRQLQMMAVYIFGAMA
jgi:hypothetical protein